MLPPVLSLTAGALCARGEAGRGFTCGPGGMRSCPPPPAEEGTPPLRHRRAGAAVGTGRGKIIIITIIINNNNKIINKARPGRTHYVIYYIILGRKKNIYLGRSRPPCSQPQPPGCAQGGAGGGRRGPARPGWARLGCLTCSPKSMAMLVMPSGTRKRMRGQ